MQGAGHPHLSGRARHRAIDISGSVGTQMPNASHRGALTHQIGEFQAISVEAVVLGSEYAAVGWTSNQVHYATRWPFNVGDEFGHTQAQMETLLGAVPRARTTPLCGSNFACTPRDLLLLPTARLKLQLRCISMMARHARGDM